MIPHRVMGHLLTDTWLQDRVVLKEVPLQDARAWEFRDPLQRPPPRRTVRPAVVHLTSDSQTDPLVNSRPPSPFSTCRPSQPHRVYTTTPFSIIAPGLTLCVTNCQHCLTQARSAARSVALTSSAGRVHGAIMR